MRKVICLGVILVLASISACCPNYVEVDESGRSASESRIKYVPTSLDSLLCRTFDTDSSGAVLDSFFGIWESKSTPIDSFTFDSLNDTLKAIHNLFDDFYSPDSQYLQTKYLILSDQIAFAVFDSSRFNLCGVVSSNSDPFDDTTDLFQSIPFRPVVKYTQKVLFLSTEFASALNYFMNEEDGNTPCIRGSIDQLTWVFLRSKEEMLRPYVPLREEVWCIGFSYLSFPTVYKVAFNSDLTKARLRYWSSSSAGGVDEYVHTELGWTRSKNISVSVQ